MKYKVLVAVDDPAIRNLLRDQLMERRHAVIVAENGPQAIERFELHEADAAIITTHLPGSHGFDVAGYIRGFRGRPNIGIVLLSTEADYLETQERFRGFNAHYPHSADRTVLYISPYESNHLLSTVEKFLTLRNA